MEEDQRNQEYHLPRGYGEASWRGALSQTIEFGWSSNIGRYARGALQAGTGGGEDRVGRRGDRRGTLSRLCWLEHHGCIRELVTSPLEDGVESVLGGPECQDEDFPWRTVAKPGQWHL